MTARNKLVFLLEPPKPRTLEVLGASEDRRARGGTGGVCTPLPHPRSRSCSFGEMTEHLLAGTRLSQRMRRSRREDRLRTQGILVRIDIMTDKSASPSPARLLTSQRPQDFTGD